jgi:hypothetical protein
MQEDDRVVKVSINPYFFDKAPANGDERYFIEGWDNAELTLGDFATCIKNGWAYCPQLQGRRSTKNFLRSNLVSVDIDHGMTIEDALQHPFVQAHLSVLYTSSSHSINYHKFRLIFLLPRDVNDATEQVILNRALARLLGGDESAVDATRIFFGSTASEPLIFDGSINQETMDKLLDLGRAAEADTVTKKFASTRRSSVAIEPEFEVVTAKGVLIRVGDIEDRATILCPFHHDQSASAFVSRNARGSTYLHCVVCKTTHWMRSGDTKDSLDERPLDFVETCRAINSMNQEHNSAASDQPTLNQHLTISFTNDKFFSLHSIPPGLTFVKSPKGSGKTTSLADTMRPLVTYVPYGSLQEFEEADDDGTPVRDTDYKILLIGHRQALIRDLCNRLDLNCYLDDAEGQTSFGKHRKHRYGVCLDSLRKVQSYKYDLIIIDEVEQILSHFLSETLKDREFIFKLFEALVVSTRSVICLDADLDWTSFLTLTEMQKRYQSNGILPDDTSIFINEYAPPSRTLKLYQSKTHLIAELIDEIREGKRCFVSSNSKSFVKRIQDVVNETFKGSKTCIAITSENSHSTEIQSFISNIRAEAQRYDVIMSSPSLGTGVDITFENEEVGIDVVYGFFEALINTHTDIDQQLGRVRHPGDVKIWISHRQFQFETNVEIAKSDLLNEHLGPSTTISIDPLTRKEIYDTENPFLVMAAQITSVQRRSKNKLRINFIDYKTKQGWSIFHVRKHEELALTGSSMFQAAVQRVLQNHQKHLLASAAIHQIQYFALKEKIEENESLSQVEMLAYLRTSAECFYCQPISNSLIRLDRQPGFRKAVRIYELLTDAALLDVEFKEHQKLPDSNNKLRFQLLPEFIGSVYLLKDIIKSLPFYVDGAFDATIEYTSDDLKQFVTICIKYKKYIDGLLRTDVRSDVGNKPTQQLGKMLKLVGLSQSKARTTKVAGSKVYHYRLDQDAIDQMNLILKFRNQYRTDPWKFVHELHGFVDPDSIRQDPDEVPGDKESRELAIQLFRYHRTRFKANQPSAGDNTHLFL